MHLKNNKVTSQLHTSMSSHTLLGSEDKKKRSIDSDAHIPNGAKRMNKMSVVQRANAQANVREQMTQKSTKNTEFFR
jgi:hypothetical protein